MNSLFPVFITPNMTEARDFYVRYFEFRVVFEAAWYVQLHGQRGEGIPPLELAFMKSNAREQPSQLQHAFAGSGVILTIEVKDVDQMHERLLQGGMLSELVVPLEDEPWGQRHFLFKDPAGILLDVVKLIPPEAEYTEAYSPANSNH